MLWSMMCQEQAVLLAIRHAMVAVVAEPVNQESPAARNQVAKVVQVAARNQVVKVVQAIHWKVC